MSKILNFGSLNIDYVYSMDHFVLPGETTSSLDRNVFAGGKGLNNPLPVKELEVWYIMQDVSVKMIVRF